jgi:magnesium transporter
MVSSYAIRDSKLVQSAPNEATVFVYTNPDAAEKQTLVESLRIDAHTLESALDPDEIARIEFRQELVYLIWKRPKNYSSGQKLTFGVNSVGVALLKDRLVFITAEDPVTFEGKSFREIESIPDVFLRFLAQTVHHFLGHLKAFKQISAEIQDKINTSMENIHLIHMFNLGESLTYYLDAIEGNGGVLGKLRASVGKTSFQSEEVFRLDDIAIDNQQCAKQATIYSTVLSGLMDARGNIINNNMNVLLRDLTLVNIVFLPLNLIAGIGGMSEYSMMTQGLDWRVTYLLFCVGMVAIAWATWRLLVRRISGQHGLLPPRKKP